jgi:ketosteroid isomerase-like protein
MSKRVWSVVLGIALITLGATEVRAQTRSSMNAADSAQIAATAARFHALLAAGDSTAALQLLSSDVAILESGGVESRADYIAHHLGADIQFAKAVPSQRTVVSVLFQGDVAWIVATSVTRGTFRDRPVNSSGAELMVLTRSGSAWLIRAIHWSSRRVNP